MDDAERLITEHYELARRQAALFCGRGKLEHLREELESAAMLGLVKASRAPILRTAQFKTFAYRCIHNEMLGVLRIAARDRRREESAQDFAEHFGVRGYQHVDDATGEVTADMT